jgi:hypothetical protein
MIDPGEANETFRVASAIAAFQAAQLAFAALVTKGFCQRSKLKKYSGRQ